LEIKIGAMVDLATANACKCLHFENKMLANACKYLQMLAKLVLCLQMLAL
jgi:hypothetical protein